MSDRKCPFCGEPVVSTSIRFDRFRCGTEGPFFDGGKEKYRTGHVCDINMYQRLLAAKDVEIERLRTTLARIAAVEGCECDSYEDHKCVLCRVRAMAREGVE